MRHNLTAMSGIMMALAVTSCLDLAGQTPAAQRHPPKEDTYTITSVIQVLKPADPTVMNDDFQAARVIAQDQDSVTIEITYYPLYQPVVGENPYWRRDDAQMTEYLRPTPTQNWDEPMREELIKELREARIDPDRLTDKQLVEQVSRWAVRTVHWTNVFAIWGIYYPNGVPTVYPPLREAFDGQKPDPTWTDQQMFEREALGRQMFYNKVCGTCTSTSIYLATLLRALGIPTRIITCIPPFDPNDETQAKMFYENIHHNKVRETVRKSLGGAGGDFTSHNFNEVYVGRHWVRLNYSTLNQPILDRHCLGLLAHVFTCSDFSKAPMAQTWGMRYFIYKNDHPKLSSENPYRLISVQDHFGANAHLYNPPVPIAELRTVTIIGLYLPGSPKVPDRVKAGLKNDHNLDFLIATREWIEDQGYQQMREFEQRAGHEFVLSAPQRPDVRARLTRSTFTSSGSTSLFLAYGASILPEDREKLAAGVPYTIRPINVSETYRWAVAPNTTVTFEKESVQ